MGDSAVGLSHANGQIAPNVDAKRNSLMDGLGKAGWATTEYYANGFQIQRSSLIGGENPWHADGRLGIVVLKD